MQNSNLVLSARGRQGRREPDGSASSLLGNMAGAMGDRVKQSKPEGIGKKKRDSGGEVLTGSSKRSRGISVLDLETAGLYKPKTKETRAAYEALLSAIRSQFGDAPHDVLCGAADEILGTLKNDMLRDPERKAEIGTILGEISNEKFTEFVAIGKLITDFTSEQAIADSIAAGGNGMDEELGVAVEFEDEEEDEDEDALIGTVVDEDDMDDIPDDEGGVQALRDDDGVDEHDDVMASRGSMIPVQEIDGFWLQRRISKTYDDLEANQAQDLAEKVFSELEKKDTRDIENKLVMLLDFERFDLVKELILNKERIVWCMRLARAENGAEREEIEQHMMETQSGEVILHELKGTRASARDRENAVERSIREEARRLRHQTGMGHASSSALETTGRKVLDLDALRFAEEGHLNSNKSTTLPEGSYRTVQKGYEEVHVPALKPKPFARGEKLKTIKELPEWAQPGFKGMKSLNRIQSKVYDTALFSSENMLVCAPTGAGKTNVAMLTMLHEIGMHRRSDGSIDTSSFKMIYVAPMKALVAEMVGNFTKRLEPYGIKVRELTGDISMSRAEIEETQLIIVTPEKWDIITRKSGERAYTQLVKLVIIDEIHLLHDSRGPVLECLVARTLRQVESTQEMVRLVGLSATLPNYEDVAAFLRVSPDKGLFHFDNSFRPCPLAQQYIGVTIKKPLQRFQLMNEICYNKVMEAAGKHQVLIFVHSRKETAKTASFIKEEAMKNETLMQILKDDSASREILETEAEAVKSADLKGLLPFGLGIHHAGMTRADRTLVEDLFADGHIQVLVSTATLAWGVNLPAHTVIIKGTQIYNPVKSAWTELSPLDVMQMFGRAGRPQFDTFGEGIIITAHSELQFYLSLFNMQLPVESQMVSTLANNLNAEIVLGTVQSIEDAATWLGYTFLYVRMLCNPMLYGMPLDAIDSDPTLKDRRLDLAHTASTMLDKHNLVRYDRRSGALQSTDLGRIASHYYVSIDTIAAFNEFIRPTMGDIELMRLFTQAEEFKYMIVREEEKLELAKLIDRVPIPIKEGLDEPAAKINVLLQAHISRLRLEGLSLSSDMVYVTQSAGRLMRCLYEVCCKRGWASLADKALTLSKCVQVKMWASQTPLRQFAGIPAEILMKVERKELPWERWYDLSSQEIGELIRFPKMGKTLHRLIHQFPRLELGAHVQPITRTLLKVEVVITPDFAWDEKIHGYVEPFIVLVEDADSEYIIHQENFLLTQPRCEEDSVLTFTLPITDPLPPQYFIRIISDKWLGCESTLPLSFRHLILPEKFSPPTDLLDLQPLPVSSLRNKTYESMYSDSLSEFNPIQTQTFNTIYGSDDSVFVAAPKGSGTTLLAELAILRMLNNNAEQGKAVYVAPVRSTLEYVQDSWAKKFGALGVEVNSLTGEPLVDAKILAQSQIVVASPQAWEALSRRWRQRKAVQQISLFIVDDVHLVGGREGPVIEIGTSRVRYISSQLPSPIRILGLSASLANAKDVGDWIGAGSSKIFNFAPSVRPVPLEIQINGFDINSQEARMQAMARPAYRAISRDDNSKHPSIIFVPTRKHAKKTALDILTFAAGENDPEKFRTASDEDILPFLDAIKDAALKHSLTYGVGYLHQSQTSQEQNIVKALFSSGAIQSLVVAASECWGLQSCAKTVVIMGTQYYDATGHVSNDYSIADLLQMVGLAGRTGIDTRASCILMCHTPRKEYYKKFLFEPLPVESHLDASLHDALCAEIVAKTVQNKQDAVDYITWTLYYRRLTQNPNYYNMTGVTHRHVSDHLSDLVENVLSDLEESGLISIENDFDLEAMNLGMIAAYYCVKYTTLEIFAASLGQKTKLKGLMEILSASSEYDGLYVRPGEELSVQKLLAHAPLALERPRYADAHTKVNALLQAHISRTHMNADFKHDAKEAVLTAPKLIQAMVDVISSSGWLNPALAAMELSQMITQAVWQRDPVLLQIPGVSRDVAKQVISSGVETIFDISDMEEGERQKVLQIQSEEEMRAANAWLDRYPDIEVTYKILSEDIAAGEPVLMAVSLEREGEPSPVNAPFYPGRRDENWWLVVGHVEKNQLLAIKRVSLQKTATAKLQFTAPEETGSTDLTLFIMSDSYLGCDQELDVQVNIQ